MVQVRRENGVEVDLTLLPVGKHHLMMWVGCMTFSTEGVYCEEVQTLPAAAVIFTDSGNSKL